MTFLASVLIIVVCVLLILVVLIQNSKGGGIQSQFGAANQIMGVKRGTEVIEKLTWGLAIGLFFLSIVLAPKNAQNTVSEEESTSKLKNRASTAAPLPQQQQQQQPMQQMPNK
jgi:preprotein translocase subunit SecG